MIFAETLPVYIGYSRARTEHVSVRVHNSLTVDDNLWTLKFDNFPEFQNVISDSSLPLTPNVIMTQCVRKSICDSPLS